MSWTCNSATFCTTPCCELCRGVDQNCRALPPLMQCGLRDILCLEKPPAGGSEYHVQSEPKIQGHTNQKLATCKVSEIFFEILQHMRLQLAKRCILRPCKSSGSKYGVGHAPPYFLLSFKGHTGPMGYPSKGQHTAGPEANGADAQNASTECNGQHPFNM